MGSFFAMHHAENEEYDPYGVAYAPESTDLFLLPVSGNKVTKWKLLDLMLKEGKFADYLSNDLGARLCSEKLMNIIEKNRSPQDILQWLESIVFSETYDEQRSYYVLHFPVNYSILDMNKSIIAGGGKMIVKPVFCLAAVKDHSIFTLPNEAGRRCYVSEKLKSLIEAEECSGLAFTKVAVSK